MPEREPGQEHDAKPVGSTVEAVIEDSDPELWRVHSGETLRGVLSRWGVDRRADSTLIGALMC